MAKNVAQFMLERMSDWGVERIYGYSGDGINGLLGAFHEVGDRVELVKTNHEELVAFAACTHAKLTDLGGGARGGPTHSLRGQHGSGGAAAAATHPLQAGQGIGPGIGQRRPQ